MLVLSHLQLGTGGWPDGKHWLTTIYTRKTVHRYWTGAHKLKVGRNVYRPSGCMVVGVSETRVSGLLPGPLMGREASRYHKTLRSIPPPPPITSDPWVIDIVGIRPTDLACEWIIETTISDRFVEKARIIGLEFSFALTKYWHPDPIAVKQFYIEEQRTMARLKWRKHLTKAIGETIGKQGNFP